MIVKDEARVIERCLRSVRPWVDSWLIVDTGSSDDTPSRVRAAMRGIPGELVQRPWRDFGYNRTEALQLARERADYLLFIDADEQLSAAPGIAWPEVMDKPAYSIEARFGGLSYDRVALVSALFDWRWRGVLHEYLDAGIQVEQPRLPGFRIDVTPDGARSSDPRKYEKDAALLEAALQVEPDNTRYAFYLAQSYRDCGQPDKACEAYRRRAAMGGWDEEAWYAQYQVARLSEVLEKPAPVVLHEYLRAFEARPQRAETLTALAHYCRSRQQWQQAYLFASDAAGRPRSVDRLFVDLTVYQWRALDELALAAFYTGRLVQAEACWRQLLANPDLPASERARIEVNIGFLSAQDSGRI